MRNFSQHTLLTRKFIQSHFEKLEAQSNENNASHPIPSFTDSLNNILNIQIDFYKKYLNSYSHFHSEFILKFNLPDLFLDSSHSPNPSHSSHGFSSTVPSPSVANGPSGSGIESGISTSHSTIALTPSTSSTNNTSKSNSSSNNSSNSSSNNSSNSTSNNSSSNNSSNSNGNNNSKNNNNTKKVQVGLPGGVQSTSKSPSTPVRSVQSSINQFNQNQIQQHNHQNRTTNQYRTSSPTPSRHSPTASY